MYTGPNIVDTGLVFGYDTGYGSTTNLNYSRLFAGKPVANLLTGIGNAQGTQNGTYFKTNYGDEIAYIPALGNRSIRFVNIYNDYYGGSGQCCPSLFSFGDFSVSPSTVYTYQIIFKTLNGYYSSNYMYQYQFNGGTYVGEFGLVDGSRMEDLGDGWKHAWGTFTTNSNTNRLITYLFHYEYSTWNKVQIAGISLTPGNTVLRPNQIPSVATTRQSTQSLIDAKRATTIDVSNVSFNTTGNITFDGTDDYINLPQNIQAGFTSATYSFICRPTSLPSGTYHQLYIQENSTWIALYNFGGATFFGIDLNNGSGWFDNNGGFTTGARTTSTLSANTYYHVVYTWDGSTVRVYLNGSLQATVSTLQAGNGRQNVTTLGSGTTSRNIGSRYSGGGNNWVGEINAVLFYNRALSATEVTQQFQAYRTRFGI